PASTCVLSRQAGSSRPWDGRNRGFGSGSAHGGTHATPHLRSDPALDAVGICYRSLQTDRSFAAEPVNIDECTDRGCLGDHSGGRRARDGKQLGSEQASGEAAGYSPVGDPVRKNRGAQRGGVCGGLRHLGVRPQEKCATWTPGAEGAGLAWTGEANTADSS